MKTDINGCSTCQTGTEHYELFELTFAGRKQNKYAYQYDYRHTNGKLFSIVRPTLEKCRQLRDEWIINQTN
jgi:hypothetical protein